MQTVLPFMSEGWLIVVLVFFTSIFWPVRKYTDVKSICLRRSSLIVNVAATMSALLSVSVGIRVAETTAV